MFNEEDFTEGPIDLKYIQKLADKMPIFFFIPPISNRIYK